METASVVPHVNQCEFHPLQNPTELRRFCADAGIQFQGYCPLGKGQLLDEPEVVEVARAVAKTPAQVLIRWSVQNGAVTIPKSTKKERIHQNSLVRARLQYVIQPCDIGHIHGSLITFNNGLGILKQKLGRGKGDICVGWRFCLEGS